MDKGSGLLLGNLGQAGQSRPLKISASSMRRDVFFFF